MPGIAAKWFLHLEDWTPVPTCPEATAEVVALLNGEAEVLLAGLGDPEAMSQGAAEPAADELTEALAELERLAAADGAVQAGAGADAELEGHEGEPALIEGAGGVVTILSISDGDVRLEQIFGEAELPDIDGIPDINCKESRMILFLGNDNLVRFKKFKNKATDTYLNSATVTATLYTEDDPPPTGTPVVAAQTLVHDGGTDGTYELTWDKTLLSPGSVDLTEGQYILVYNGVEGSVDLEKRVLVEVRYRTEDFSDSGI